MRIIYVTRNGQDNDNDDGNFVRDRLIKLKIMDPRKGLNLSKNTCLSTFL